MVCSILVTICLGFFTVKEELSPFKTEWVEEPNWDASVCVFPRLLVLVQFLITDVKCDGVAHRRVAIGLR